jgi:exodeoxyribonuclease VII small subunit
MLTMSNDSPKLTDLTFEEAYAQLEEIAAQLESGDLSLDDSVALYERGQALARRCGELLDSAELRIQQINDAGEIRPLS